MIMPLPKIAALFASCLLIIVTGGPSWAAGGAMAPAAASAVAAATSYADLADLSDSAQLVVRAQIRRLARVEPERARGVRQGWARYYVEARTGSLLAGPGTLGADLRYLADMPLDARGKPPLGKKAIVLLFARAVPGQPGELQLVAPDAQIGWTADNELRLRAILSELLSPDAPKRIAGVREAIHVAGALAGEGETQMFLATSDGSASSINVVRRPGEAPVWGVSFSEVLEGGKPAARETLAWYRLACFLPPALPAGVNLSETAEDRVHADADYALVMAELGACPRARHPR